MIKINNVAVYGLSESVVASGYPMRSDLPKDMERPNTPSEKDVLRAFKLAGCAIGEGHDNFLNGVIVQFDLTAPIKVWTEAQRYHFLDFVSSASTMHRLAQFNLADDGTFDESVIPEVKKILVKLQSEHADLVAAYNNEGNPEMKERLKKSVKEAYLRLLMNCPVGLNLTARMTTNYRQLRTIYQQRKTHRLPHWHEFCRWVERLPMSGMITGKR